MLPIMQVQHGGTEQYSDWYRRRQFAILNVIFSALSLTAMVLALVAVSWRIWSVRALLWCDLHSVVSICPHTRSTNRKGYACATATCHISSEALSVTQLQNEQN